MFRSLRGKLVASYSLVILLCLLLAGSAFVYLLRDYQRQIKLNQLSDLAVPISWQVRLLERAGASPNQIALFLRDRADEMEVRILLVDSSGQVVEDTDGSLQGGRIAVPPAWQPRKDPASVNSVAFIREGSPGFVFIVAQTSTSASPDDRFTARVPSYFVALAVPEQSLTSSWLELAPRLSFAALVSMIVSIGAAFLLSRSISRPIAEITRASEEMARGNFDQNIQVRSRDEVGRLAEAFNHMARQVSVSHRTMRDFLANVSHDLRTPLTSVQGFSQAMLDGTIKAPEEYGEAAQIINDESGRMRRMVEDLLLLSKIESGQMPLDRSKLDLRELLRVCVRRAGPQAQQAGVNLVLEADHPVGIIGDEGRLEEVVRNLLDNALRHTPEGGAVTVKLGMKHAPAPAPAPAGNGREKGNGPTGSEELRVSVHNTGSYIPPEDQTRVFERFYQVDKSRARNSDGSGLGLAIASEIVHAHGGTISVESDPTAGTTFTVAISHQPSAVS
ncbi:MAG: sensor histidine kinase [Chloroflexota bacterium]